MVLDGFRQDTRHGLRALRKNPGPGRSAIWDFATFAAVSALLLGVAALAAFVPAGRATAVDPLSSLRSE